jgi:hypothetical protein
MFTPASRSRSISSRLCGSSANALTDAASTGPTSGAACNVSSDALNTPSMVRKCRARLLAAFSPTCRIPSA